MNKCIRCGSPTPYDNLICDDCRAIEYEDGDLERFDDEEKTIPRFKEYEKSED